MINKTIRSTDVQVNTDDRQRYIAGEIMVLGVILGAVFGAIFGYITGWVIQLFPNFNTALLEGIQAITGISNITMPALLAGIGFLLGLVLGIINEFTKKRR